MTSPTPVASTPWHFPPVDEADEHGLIGVGADLEPATLIHAYRHAMFPMPAGDADDAAMAWWSPPERGVLPLDQLVLSRSLKRSCRRFEVSIDAAFSDVIATCAAIERPGGWISPPIINAYRRLHALGWAHSVEVWEDGELAGGLYGVQIAGLFAGESMFHHSTDASKVALVALVASLDEVGAELLDVQWQTDHLATLGVRAITRGEYLRRLHPALLSRARSLGSLAQGKSQDKSRQFLDRLLWMPTGRSSP